MRVRIHKRGVASQPCISSRIEIPFCDADRDCMLQILLDPTPNLIRHCSVATPLGSHAVAQRSIVTWIPVKGYRVWFYPRSLHSVKEILHIAITRTRRWER